MSNYDEVKANYCMLERCFPKQTISMLVLKCLSIRSQNQLPSKINRLFTAHYRR